MHYVERLVRRALAVPREQPKIPFDPFEQVAPWLPDGPLAVAPDKQEITGPQAEASTRQAPAPAAVPTAHPVPPATCAPQRVETTIPAPGVEPPVTPQRVAPSVEVIGEAPPRQVAPPPAAGPAPLTQADAFMRSLGVEMPAPAAPAAERIAAPPPADPTVRTAAPSRREPAGRDLPPPFVIVQPLRPPAPAPAQRRGRESSPVEKPTQPQPPRRAAPPAAAERIVQTTVVVAPPSRRLDDLARSSGISRFGIGQS
jgi:hypothetical protein